VEKERMLVDFTFVNMGPIVQLKSDKLLENPEEDNQQPS